MFSQPATQAAEASGVGSLPMAVLGLTMLGTYALIASGKLHRVTAALCGAIVCTVLGLVFGGLHEFDEVHQVLAKDIGVLGVIVGTSILVDVAGKSGLFQFLAVKIAKRAKGDPQQLFTALILLAVLFVSLLTIAPGTLSSRRCRWYSAARWSCRPSPIWSASRSRPTRVPWSASLPASAP